METRLLHEATVVPSCRALPCFAADCPVRVPGVQDAAARQRQARGRHGVVGDFERQYSHYMRYSLKWDWKCCHLRKENNLGKKPAFGPFGNLLHFQNQVVRQRHPATRRQQEVPRLLPDAGMRCHAFLVSLGSRVTATATREKEEKKVREWRKAQAKQLSCLDSTEFSCEAFAKKLLMRISFYIISTNLGFIHHGIFCDGCSDGEEWRQAFKSRDFVPKKKCSLELKVKLKIVFRAYVAESIKLF